VCETIGRLVLALEVDHVAFYKVIFPLVKEVELQQIEKPGYSLDLVLPLKKKVKRVLDCD
jgi:hypothetical protein